MGAFNLPYTNPKANQSEMIEAGLFTHSTSFSATTTGTTVSGLLASPSSISGDVATSGSIVVHGVSVVNGLNSSNAFLVRVYGGTSGKTVAIGGGNRFGPFIYNFDQPVVLEQNEELIYHVLANTATGAKYLFVNFAVNEAITVV
jgi:hypothetical protein